MIEVVDPHVTMFSKKVTPSAKNGKKRANLIFNTLHELLTDTNWIKWDLWTTSSNKSSCAFTSVRANGVVTGVIGSTSICREAFIKI